MERLIELLRGLIAREWYGELVIKFEQGRIVLIKKTESIKP